MKEYIWETAEEIDKALADRIRGTRKRRKISQQSLSKESGVSLGSIKRFEATGLISLVSLTKIAMALGCVEEIKNLFQNIPYRNIEEVIHESR